MMRLTAAVAVLLASMAPCAVEGFAAPASAAALRHNGFTGCTVAAPLVQGKVHPAFWHMPPPLLMLATRNGAPVGGVAAGLPEGDQGSVPPSNNGGLSCAELALGGPHDDGQAGGRGPFHPGGCRPAWRCRREEVQPDPRQGSNPPADPYSSSAAAATHNFSERLGERGIARGSWGLC